MGARRRPPSRVPSASPTWPRSKPARAADTRHGCLGLAGEGPKEGKYRLQCAQWRLLPLCIGTSGATSRDFELAATPSDIEFDCVCESVFVGVYLKFGNGYGRGFLHKV